MKHILGILFLLFACSAHGQTTLLIDDGTGHKLTQKVQSLGGTSKTISWPGVTGSANNILITDGANPGTLAWASITGLIGGAYIRNQSSQQTSANFNIDGTGTAFVFNATGGFQFNTSAATAGYYLRGNGVYFVPGAIQAGDLPSLASGYTGILPIANGGTGSATTSQNFAFIGPPSGSGAPSFRALVAGDLPSLAGSYIQNQYTAQTSAGFYVTAGAPAKTSNFIETRIKNDATSSTNGVNMYGLYIETKGTNSGTVAQNNGIAFDVSGGTSNYDLVGTSGLWNIKASGDASLNSTTLFNPLTVANGGTGQTTANAAFNALAPSQTANAGKLLTTNGTNTSWTTTLPAGSGSYIQNGTSQQTSADFNVDGTGRALVFDAGTASSSTGTVKFFNSTSSHFTALQTGGGATADVTYSLPPADGTANQVLSTSGGGTLSWATVATPPLVAYTATIDLIVPTDGTFSTANNGKRFMPLYFVFYTTLRTGGGAAGTVAVGITAPNYTDYLAASGYSTSTQAYRQYIGANGADVNSIAPATTVTVHIAAPSTYLVHTGTVIVVGREQ